METMKRIKNGTYDRWVNEWIHNAGINGRNCKRMDSILGMQSFLNAQVAIVAGSGPSLMADLDELNAACTGERSQAKKKAILFAGQSNTPTLLANGIVPDFIVICDGGASIVKQIEGNILPMAHELRRWGTRFILATSVNPEIPRMLEKARIDMLWFKYLPTITNDNPRDFANVYAMTMGELTPLLDFYLLQAGCVVNASAGLALAMTWNDKAPKLDTIVFSGADFSYPNGVARCDVELWAKEQGRYVTQEKSKLPPDVEKFGGILTDATQVAYRGDLQYMVQLVDAKRVAPENKGKPMGKEISFYTTADNFIADFMPIGKIGDILYE